MKKTISPIPRVRIAPSPTGFLHLGTARTALFNFLFARKEGGKFILRIEDTDIERSKKEFEEDIIENLRWLGIEWDEGPDIGGKYAPYRQSERKEIYKFYLEKLLKEKRIYRCFCTKEELEAKKQEQISRGEAPRYDGKCRNLSEKEVKKYLLEQKPFVLRFKVPSKKIILKDLIRGKIEFDTTFLGDFVVAKDFFSPLYNFSVVVDDFEMKITHIIRGEDHLPNTPKQILLQEALGFPRPQYAHLPLILGPDQRKLSKRHGSVAVRDYKQQGYLPEALVNFIAFLGWNPGDEREIFSISSLIKEFSLERVKKGAAIFNIKKLDYLNGFYIRQKPIEKLTKLCIPYLIRQNLIEEISEITLISNFSGVFLIKETGEKIDFEFLKKIISLYQERLKKLSEIPQLVDFFFKKELDYPKEMLRWKNMEDKEIKAVLDKLEKIFLNIKKEDFTKQNLEQILIAESEKLGDRGKLLWPLRVALTGKEASAPPFEIAEILGKEKVIERIRFAKKLLR